MGAIPGRAGSARGAPAECASYVTQAPPDGAAAALAAPDTVCADYAQRLPRLIGLRRAKELMLLGHWLSAREALELGLINRVVPTGQLSEKLNELASQLAGLSGSANRTVKMLANRGLDLPLAEGLELEIRGVAQHMSSADAREGLSAFIEKRKPKFN